VSSSTTPENLKARACPEKGEFRLKKLLLCGVAVFVLVCIAFGLWRFRSSHALKLDTTYQAVLLDNGQAYYGKIEQMDRELTVLTDVYYIQSQVDQQTKEAKSILIRRGSEWHAPSRSILNTRHIIMVEPVTAGSKVAELIAASKGKNP
jgi:hypothetical protein